MPFWVPKTGAIDPFILRQLAYIYFNFFKLHMMRTQNSATPPPLYPPGVCLDGSLRGIFLVKCVTDFDGYG